MNLSDKKSIRLVARNEGKIKSYDSCSDVRAWSHDVTTQDRYLREWMKGDMPASVIPTSILSGFLRTMTCGSRRRATPRCHPDCKSKVLLDSICASCNAVKRCLKLKDNLEEYFIQEDIETSHWPCDKCLEALKSIKMFWKIIASKIFNIKLSKCDAFEPSCEAANSIKSVSKIWQNEILQQTFYVKTLPPVITKVSKILSIGSLNPELTDSSRPSRSSRVIDNHQTLASKKTSNCSRETYVAPRINRKVSKCTSVRLKKNDIGCDPCIIKSGCDEINAYKNNINILQDRCNEQTQELSILKNENMTLKLELDSLYKKCPWKASFYVSDNVDTDPYHVCLLPKPFEAHLDESCQPKCIDSEMIITMKNCKNESYKHVSLLQVLHKTNDPLAEDIPGNGTHYKKEDPIVLLNKVQNTFGAIVKRELNIINERKNRPKKTEVDATFQNINTTRSHSSCSTASSRMSSETDFISSQDFSGGQNIKVLHI